jgi:polysaccharide export outer membrane protein
VKKKLMIKSINQMFYRGKFFNTLILSLICFSLREGLFTIEPTLSKNVMIRNFPRQGDKQLSIPKKPDKTIIFDYLEPVPQGYQQPNFSEENEQLFNSYRLDFGDSISVTVERFPEFSFAGVVDAEGNVFVPLLGRISVKGLNLEEVETKIKYELGRRFLQEEPEVFAFLSAQRPVTLTILGEIVRPGYYTISQGTPMSTVINLAGGSTENADLRAVLVKRTLTDGTVVEEKLDLYAPLVEGNEEPKVRLQAGDTVIVSQLEVGEERNYDRLLISRSTLPQQTILVRVVAPIQPAGVALRNLPLPNGSTFLDAVGQLTQFIPLITKNDITLMRFDPELGKVVTQTLNVAETVEDGEITHNVQLRDDDVIIVSRTLLGKVLAGIRVLTQPIRDIFGFSNFFQNIFDGNNRGFGGFGGGRGF